MFLDKTLVCQCLSFYPGVEICIIYMYYYTGRLVLFNAEGSLELMIELMPHRNLGS